MTTRLLYGNWTPLFLHVPSFLPKNNQHSHTKFEVNNHIPSDCT